MCTGFVQHRLRGEVRLYDVRAQRGPTTRAIAPVGDEPLKCIAWTPDGRYIIAGTASGSMARLDTRKGLASIGAYKGAAGARSVASPSIHPTAGRMRVARPALARL